MDNPINIWFTEEPDKLVRKEPDIWIAYHRTMTCFFLVLAKTLAKSTNIYYMVAKTLSNEIT
jgi:hypothetical protein